jgi:hypothetical protein
MGRFMKYWIMACGLLAVVLLCGVLLTKGRHAPSQRELALPVEVSVETETGFDPELERRARSEPLSRGIAKTARSASAEPSVTSSTEVEPSRGPPSSGPDAPVVETTPQAIREQLLASNVMSVFRAHDGEVQVTLRDGQRLKADGADDMNPVDWALRMQEKGVPIEVIVE